MSRYTFDCYVCDETLVTADLAEVVEFSNAHAGCGRD